ncbi:MAG TPA: hypothetical protein VMR21_02890 [Vicinamibacteria bacterium]|nr:hypothetical protein [Vicinamibacteria bacterium]
MILLLAARSLAAHPVRSAMLACGFGLGVSVMATLLGVGEVILEQARSPALAGGGDVVIAGTTGRVSSARWVLSSVLGASPLRERVAAFSPRARGRLFLVREGRVVPVAARGGVPSLERAVGDAETAGVESWVDAPGDAAWVSPDPAEVLRAMDRFHPVPDVPERLESWAEWLYFNGGTARSRFYLTFLVGPPRPGGRRAAGVRLQLDRDGRMVSYGEGAEVDAAQVLAAAPDLAIADSRVRLEGRRYHITLDLPRVDPAPPGAPPRLHGELTLDAEPGRSLPPLVVRGARGWLSGYVVPVMSGSLGGVLHLGKETITFDGGTGYHDHNWGFWEGVTWQWGQVQHGGLSLVYGRVRPPPDAADPDRMPGFLAVLGPHGPIGYAASISIVETSDPATGRPGHIAVSGRGPSLDLKMDLAVESAVVTRMPPRSFGADMDFLQLRARYRVAGEAGGRRLDFEAPGAAETFRGR